jgi:hypothetical protein
MRLHGFGLSRFRKRAGNFSPSFSTDKFHVTTIMSMKAGNILLPLPLAPVPLATLFGVRAVLRLMDHMCGEPGVGVKYAALWDTFPGFLLHSAVRVTLCEEEIRKQHPELLGYADDLEYCVRDLQDMHKNQAFRAKLINEAEKKFGAWHKVNPIADREKLSQHIQAKNDEINCLMKPMRHRASLNMSELEDAYDNGPNATTPLEVITAYESNLKVMREHATVLNILDLIKVTRMNLPELRRIYIYTGVGDLIATKHPEANKTTPKIR